MGICKSESENELRENQPPSPLGARDAENEQTDRVGKRGSLAGEGGGGVTRGVGSRGRPRAGDPAGRVCPAGGHRGRAGLCRLPLPVASARTARSRGHLRLSPVQVRSRGHSPEHSARGPGRSRASRVSRGRPLCLLLPGCRWGPGGHEGPGGEQSASEAPGGCACP